MNNIISASRNEAYRQSLSSEEQFMHLANPAGEIELTDAELEAIYGAGGHRSAPVSDQCVQSILFGGRCENMR